MSHQGEESDSFQDDGFSARVRAGDDQLATLAFQFDGDRNDGASLGFEIALEKGMASIVEDQRTLRKPAFARPGPFDFAQGKLSRAAVPT